MHPPIGATPQPFWPRGGVHNKYLKNCDFSRIYWKIGQKWSNSSKMKGLWYRSRKCLTSVQGVQEVSRRSTRMCWRVSGQPPNVCCHHQLGWWRWSQLSKVRVVWSGPFLLVRPQAGIQNEGILAIQDHLKMSYLCRKLHFKFGLKKPEN